MNEQKKKVDEESIENLTSEKVTEEKIENSLNYDILTKEEQKAIDEFNSKIDVTDTT